jgi:uncharacterized protein
MGLFKAIQNLLTFYVDKNYNFSKALAYMGSVAVQAALGDMHYKGRGIPQDYAEAAKWYRKAAEQGYADAQYFLGHMYYEGEGVPQDYTEAAKWYGKAADQGNAYAQIFLGLMYSGGIGVSQDYVLAYLCFNLATSRFPASEKEKREKAIKHRVLVSSNMSLAQIVEAQKLAREWKPKNERLLYRKWREQPGEYNIGT